MTNIVAVDVETLRMDNRGSLKKEITKLIYRVNIL